MYRNLRIGTKILVVFLLISVVAVSLLGLFAIRTGGAALEEESFNKLTAIREMKATQIEDYFRIIAGQVVTVSGTGGCNSYSADITSSGGQLLAVAPITVSAMACDDELGKLEAEYLAALQSATKWRFYPGQLAIGYTATGGDQGTLFFTPVESAGADTVPE